MDNYITGATIRRLREEQGITQAELAQRIGVGSKAVSKWETAKGLPDITKHYYSRQGSQIKGKIQEKF